MVSLSEHFARFTRWGAMAAAGAQRREVTAQRAA
jgi:hypothetical protein